MAFRKFGVGGFFTYQRSLYFDASKAFLNLVLAYSLKSKHPKSEPPSADPKYAMNTH